MGLSSSQQQQTADRELHVMLRCCSPPSNISSETFCLQPKICTWSVREGRGRSVGGEGGGDRLGDLARTDKPTFRGSRGAREELR